MAWNISADKNFVLINFFSLIKQCKQRFEMHLSYRMIINNLICKPIPAKHQITGDILNHAGRVIHCNNPAKDAHVPCWKGDWSHGTQS